MKRKIILIFLLFIFTNNYIYADTSIEMTKFVNAVDEISNTFSYEIIEDENNPASVSNLTTNFDLVFDNNDIGSNNIASKRYTIDFGNLIFTKVGVYKFTIRETASSSQRSFPIDQKYYELLVNVTNDVDDNNVPTGEFIIDTLGSGLLNGSETKAEVIFETTPLTYFTLSKNVTGDMADKNEYFKFKVIIGDSNNLVINGQDSEVNYNGEVITTSNVYDPEIDNYVYLKHGQTLTFGLDNEEYQMHAGSTIAVEEMDATNYKTYINSSTSDNKGYAIVSLERSDYNTAAYTNNYESTAITGVFINTIPYVILFVVSIGGVLLTIKKTNK